jgi:gas vesicle protein
MKPAGSFISGLLAGVAIGSVIALLFAPKSGKETREQLKQKLGDIEKEFETLKAKASEKSVNLKKDIADRLAQLQKEIETLTGSI